MGHNPDPFPAVPRADAASRKNNRPRFVTEAFQVSETIVERQADDSRSVLTKDPAGPAFANNPSHLRPEVTVILLASSLPGDTKRLARESSGDEVDRLSHNVGCEGVDVVMDWNLRPVMRQHRATKRIDFAEHRRLEPGPFSGKRESTDAGKEIKHPHQNGTSSGFAARARATVSQIGFRPTACPCTTAHIGFVA